MTEREMLELAAKAAGNVRLIRNANTSETHYGAHVVGEGHFHGSTTHWNPLTDDGDAMRLAVQCGLEVSFVGDHPDGDDTWCCVGYPASEDRPCKIKYVFEDHNGDIFAATRLAITRAAAEIGRSKHEEQSGTDTELPARSECGRHDRRHDMDG